MSMEKLAAVEMILGSSISTIDTKTEQEKFTLDAKNKAKKLFGDAKERKDAKKKEKKGKLWWSMVLFSVIINLPQIITLDGPPRLNLYYSDHNFIKLPELKSKYASLWHNQSK